MQLDSNESIEKSCVRVDRRSSYSLFSPIFMYMCIFPLPTRNSCNGSASASRRPAPSLSSQHTHSLSALAKFDFRSPLRPSHSDTQRDTKATRNTHSAALILRSRPVVECSQPSVRELFRFVEVGGGGVASGLPNRLSRRRLGRSSCRV